MTSYWTTHYGNPASVHYAGRLAARTVATARKTIADHLGVLPYQLFFNSGATEGNNWIFKAFAESKPERRKIVVGAIEHKSVLNAALALKNFGFEVITIPVTPDGVIDVDVANRIIDSQTGLVAVQLANNETGVIQPVATLVASTHEQGAFFHCDTVQGLGKIPIDLDELGVDSATFSGHKIHGPKGIGILYLKAGATNFPFPHPFHGGSQEQGVRPGTLNVPSIVGLAKACDMLPEATAMDGMRRLRDHLEEALKIAVPNCVIHGDLAQRIPNTTNVALPGVASDILIANLSLFCVSNGSACNSASIEPSFVLREMGVTRDEASRSIRVSTSTCTTLDEIDFFVRELNIVLNKITIK